MEETNLHLFFCVLFFPQTVVVDEVFFVLFLAVFDKAHGYPVVLGQLMCGGLRTGSAFTELLRRV